MSTDGYNYGDSFGFRLRENPLAAGVKKVFNRMTAPINDWSNSMNYALAPKVSTNAYTPLRTGMSGNPGYPGNANTGSMGQTAQQVDVVDPRFKREVENQNQGQGNGLLGGIQTGADIVQALSGGFDAYTSYQNYKLAQEQLEYDTQLNQYLANASALEYNNQARDANAHMGHSYETMPEFEYKPS